MRRAIATVVSAAAIAAAACGSAPPSVRQSCTTRAQWIGVQAASCRDCVTLSQAPHCDCLSDSASGACAQQAAAWVNSADCAGVRSCADACKDDCACVDRCYDARPACRDVGGALAACVVATCDARCR